MPGAILALATAALCGALHGAAFRQIPLIAADTAVRFDRPIFTTEGAVHCPRQQ